MLEPEITVNGMRDVQQPGVRYQERTNELRQSRSLLQMARASA